MIRAKLRQFALDLLRRALRSPEGQRMIVDAMANARAPAPEVDPAGWSLLAREYPDLGAAPAPSSTAAPAPIFITARFRSGSTLLWNLFRQLPECTAYYEPLNERRWFDPASRGARVDASHRQVEDYWREYEGLDQLASCFQTDWNERRLYMDGQAFDPNLLAYVRALIDHASGRPVLQFNRVDFRLPWLKRHFPTATIVHLARHPRDSWYSTLMSPERCPRELSIEQFARYDELYLLAWRNDLQIAFPLLRDPALTHPYQLYYCLWKLSYAFGVTQADYHLTYESLTADPAKQIASLLAKLNMNPAAAADLAKLVQPGRQRAWLDYADESWFQRQESLCELLFQEYYPDQRGFPTATEAIAVC